MTNKSMIRRVGDVIVCAVMVVLLLLVSLPVYIWYRLDPDFFELK